MNTWVSSSSLSVKANRSLAADGLCGFRYDAAKRHTLTTATHLGEASKITYLHNDQYQHA
jgi:hypothetical protein